MQGKHKKILLYICISFIFLVLSHYRVVANCSPFAIAFLFALLQNNFNPYVLIVTFFISGILVSIDMSAVLILASQMVFAFLFYIIKVVTKYKKQSVCGYILLFLSFASFVYVNFTSVRMVILVILTIIISMIMYYIFLTVIKALVLKGYYARFSIDEKICFSITLIGFFMGLSNVTHEIDLVKIVGLLLILISSDVLKEKNVFLLAIFMGLGASLNNGVINKLAIFPIFAIVANVIQNKYVKALFVILVDLILGVVLNLQINFDLITFIFMIFSVMIYLLLPSKIINNARENIGQCRSSGLMEILEQNQRKSVAYKLNCIANAFNEVNRQYKDLVIGGLDNKKMLDYVSQVVYESTCFNCEKREECYKTKIVENSIKNYASIALSKEKLTLLDIPIELANCNRLSFVSQKIQEETVDIKKYLSQVKERDSKNIIISNQFSGAGEIIKNIGENTFDVKILHTFEKTLIERLGQHNITIREAAEIYKNMQFEELVLYIKNEDSIKENLTKVVSSVYKKELYIVNQELTNESGWSTVTMLPKERFGYVVGIAVSPKTIGEKSGDNFSVLKLDNKNYIFAIADGMGSGEKANKISETSLGLIENFYQAGLSSEMVANSVNNMILPISDDKFTALDLLRFDAKIGEVDFVKMGASVSLFLRRGRCEIIEGAALPMGAVHNAREFVSRRFLEKDDVVIMASDGIVDSFSTIEDFAKFVNNECIQNMQLLAESILEEAMARDGVSDDKTVMAIRFI